MLNEYTLFFSLAFGFAYVIVAVVGLMGTVRIVKRGKTGKKSYLNESP